MLTRVSSEEFSAPAGSEVRLVCQSRDNNGTHEATFRYNKQEPASAPLGNLPGCKFTVLPATKTFKALVVFDTAALPTARYDLFEVDPAGNLVDLHESKDPSNPVFNLGITGVAVGALVAASAPAPAPAPAGRLAPAARPAPAPALAPAARSLAPAAARPSPARRLAPAASKPGKKKSARKKPAKPRARKRKPAKKAGRARRRPK